MRSVALRTKSGYVHQYTFPSNGTLTYDPGWLYWDSCVKKTVAYCNKIGWQVDFGNYLDECEIESPRLIKICSRRKRENQLYYLLHELGHALFYLNSDNYEVITFGVAKPAYSNSNKVATVLEEMTAWHMGLGMVPALDFVINRENFDKVMVLCVRQYFEWATRKR